MAAVALSAVGVGVVVLASLGALLMRSPYDRVHFLTPATSLGAPLIGLGLALENGWGTTAVQHLVIVLLLAVTGPALAAATGRQVALRERTGAEETPP